MSSGALENTCWSCGILGLIKIPPEKKTKEETTDEQIDMQSWDRKRRKMENLQWANLLPKKLKNQQMSRQTANRFANAGTPFLAGGMW
jgi:hypothetical protein